MICSVFLFTACEKEDYWGEDVAINGNSGLIMASPYYIEATIEGKKREFKDGREGFRNRFGSFGATIDGLGTFFEKQKVIFEGNQNFEVYFMERFLDPPGKKEIEQMFRKGEYKFGNSYANSPGVEITYTDNQGRVWSTAKGSAMQINSKFNVINHYSNHFDAYTPFITEATFSCVLYDGNGNSMEVSNGRVVARTVVYE